MATLKTTVTMDRGWEQKVIRSAQRGVLAMATDIHKRAVILAPVGETSNLVNSGIIKPVTNGYMIKFGSSRVPYARIHELGGKTGRNKSVTIKAKRYLGQATESVARSNQSKYFKID
jgi:hypothetical protein